MDAMRFAGVLGATWLALCVGAAAASPFDGTWRTDPSTLRANVPPIVLELGHGTLACRSCQPPYEIKADGGFHPVPGHPEQASVSVQDDGHMTKTDRQDGQVALVERFAVAADGRTAELELREMEPTGSVRVVMRQELLRLGPDIGAKGVSGTWQVDPATVQRPPLSETLRVDNATVEVRTSDGHVGSFPVDGRIVPVAGRAGVDATSVQRPSDRVLVQTEFLNGQPVMSYRMTVSADGSAMTVETEDLAQHASTTQVARKVAD